MIKNFTAELSLEIVVELFAENIRNLVIIL